MRTGGTRSRVRAAGWCWTSPASRARTAWARRGGVAPGEAGAAVPGGGERADVHAADRGWAGPGLAAADAVPRGWGAAGRAAGGGGGAGRGRDAAAHGAAAGGGGRPDPGAGGAGGGEHRERAALEPSGDRGDARHAQPPRFAPA